MIFQLPVFQLSAFSLSFAHSQRFSSSLSFTIAQLSVSVTGSPSSLISGWNGGLDDRGGFGFRLIGFGGLGGAGEIEMLLHGLAGFGGVVGADGAVDLAVHLGGFF
jgi:hypothetical protein